MLKHSVHSNDVSNSTPRAREMDIDIEYVSIMPHEIGYLLHCECSNPM